MKRQHFPPFMPDSIIYWKGFAVLQWNTSTIVDSDRRLTEMLRTILTDTSINHLYVKILVFVSYDIQCHSVIGYGYFFHFFKRLNVICIYTVRLNKKKCDVNFIKFEHLFFLEKRNEKITASVVNTLLGWWCVLLISEPRSELWTGIQRAYTVRVTFSLLHNMSVTFSNTKYTSTWEIPSTTNSIPSWIIFRY